MIAWADELRRVHHKLRTALAVTREALTTDGSAPALDRDLALLCRGFCTALDTHHRGEDAQLFPAITAAHPELAPTLHALRQDHVMIGHLIGDLQGVLDRGGPVTEVVTHLDGVEAIMESHFRYEERQLLGVLDVLALHAAPVEVLGTLARNDLSG